MKNIFLKGLTITTLVLTLVSSANAGYQIRSNPIFGTTTITGAGGDSGYTTTCRYNSVFKTTYCN